MTTTDPRRLLLLLLLLLLAPGGLRMRRRRLDAMRRWDGFTATIRSPTGLHVGLMHAIRSPTRCRAAGKKHGGFKENITTAA